MWTQSGEPLVTKSWGARLRFIMVVVFCDRILMRFEALDLSYFLADYSTSFSAVWEKAPEQATTDFSMEECQWARNLTDPAWKTNVESWLEDAEMNNKTKIMPPRTPGAVVHIGKSAGSTISIKLRHGCHSFVPKPCHRNGNPINYTKVNEQN